MDPSGAELILAVTMLAVVLWMFVEGPLSPVARAVSLFWSGANPDLTERQDLVEIAPRRGTWATRVVLGVLIGGGLVGTTLYPTTLDFYHVETAEAAALFAQYNQHDPARNCATGAVAGFPWRGVEGCPGAAWSLGASLARSSYAMWFNFVCLASVGMLIAFVVSRRRLIYAACAIFPFALFGGVCLLGWLIEYRD